MYRSVNATIKIRAINEEDLHTYIALIGADSKRVTFESFPTNELTPFQQLLEDNANPQHKSGRIQHRKIKPTIRPDYSTPPGDYLEVHQAGPDTVEVKIDGKGRIFKKKTQ